MLLSPPALAERQELSLRLGDQTRRFIMHVPKAAKTNPDLPVMLVLHPASARGSYMEKTTRLHARGADYIVIYPDGYKRSWNAGECCGKAHKHGIDDRLFFLAMARHAQRYTRGSRLFLVGYSNGAMLAYHLACKHPDLITAIAVFGGSHDMGQCASGAPVGLLHMHGSQDASIPVQGGPPRLQAFQEKLGSLPPARDAVLAVARRNGCGAAGATARWQDWLGTPCQSWSRACGASAHLCVIPELGHTWPGAAGDGLMGRWFGPARPELDASAAVLDFFADFRP